MRGYTRHDVVNAQFSTISLFNTSHPVTNVIDADVITLIFNAGMQYLPGISDGELSSLNANRAALNGDPLARRLGGSNVDPEFEQNADNLSWGYQLAVAADYTNVFSTPWKLTPSINFRHDVSGFAAGPMGPGFVEGTKAVTLGLTGQYQSAWRANVSYTNEFGNDFYNYKFDRDFIAASVSYAF